MVGEGKFAVAAIEVEVEAGAGGEDGARLGAGE